MSGYAVSARIVRAGPRLVVRYVHAAAPAGRVTVMDCREASAARSVVEPGALEECWGRLCDRLSQLTFYLFDANSWR